MGALLYIPWFKAEQINVPLPFPILGIDAIPIQPFGVLVAVGVLSALRVSENFARRNRWSPEVASDFFVHAFGIGFVGAIVLNAIFYYPAEVWDMMTGKMPWRMLGLSSFGGFFGSIFGVRVWKKRRDLPLLPIADAAAYSFPFGWVFGRSGCFIVHDHPGRVTDFFLAVADYPVGPPPFEPRHDLGFYEVLWSIGCMALFMYLGRKERRPGLYLALLPLLYAPIRFFLDFLRAGSDLGGDVRYVGFTPGQYSSIAFLLLGVMLLRKVLTTEPAPLPAGIAWPPVDESDSGDGPKSKKDASKASAKVG
jgi:phosphatidylglycerol:prolipoprotein diacylglycerol transferase